MTATRLNPFIFCLLVMALLSSQWASAHIHLPGQHDHGGVNHQHNQTAHSHFSINHHSDVIDVGHEAASDQIV